MKEKDLAAIEINELKKQGFKFLADTIKPEMVTKEHYDEKSEDLEKMLKASSDNNAVEIKLLQQKIDTLQTSVLTEADIANIQSDVYHIKQQLDNGARESGEGASESGKGLKLHHSPHPSHQRHVPARNMLSPAAEAHSATGALSATGARSTTGTRPAGGEGTAGGAQAAAVAYPGTGEYPGAGPHPAPGLHSAAGSRPAVVTPPAQHPLLHHQLAGGTPIRYRQQAPGAVHVRGQLQTRPQLAGLHFEGTRQPFSFHQSNNFRHDLAFPPPQILQKKAPHDLAFPPPQVQQQNVLNHDLAVPPPQVQQQQTPRHFLTVPPTHVQQQTVSHQVPASPVQQPKASFHGRAGPPPQAQEHVAHQEIQEGRKLSETEGDGPQPDGGKGFKRPWDFNLETPPPTPTIRRTNSKENCGRTRLAYNEISGAENRVGQNNVPTGVGYNAGTIDGQYRNDAVHGDGTTDGRYRHGEGYVGGSMEGVTGTGAIQGGNNAGISRGGYGTGVAQGGYGTGMMTGGYADRSTGENTGVGGTDARYADRLN